MSQNDDQNRNRQDQSEGYQDANSDQSKRESRSGSSSPDRDSMDNQTSRAGRPDQGADVENTDEMDEDRDDDQRTDGGSNRRRNIS